MPYFFRQEIKWRGSFPWTKNLGPFGRLRTFRLNLPGMSNLGVSLVLATHIKIRYSRSMYVGLVESTGKNESFTRREWISFQRVWLRFLQGGNVCYWQAYDESIAFIATRSEKSGVNEKQMVAAHYDSGRSSPPRCCYPTTQLWLSIHCQSATRISASTSWNHPSSCSNKPL